MSEKKVCRKCKIEKNIDEFGFRCVSTGTKLSQCKKCRSSHMKTYYENNKEEIDEKHKNYHNEHKKEDNERDRKWYFEKGGKELQKKYKKENIEKIREKERERYNNEPHFRMKKILRSRFKKTVFGEKKNKSVINMLGIELQMFKKWLEYNFDDKMNWNNHGKYWELDHVVPCDSFNLEKQTDIEKCFHWTNMQPLEKKENNQKNNKILNDMIEKQKKKVEEFKIKYLHEK